MPAGDWRKSKGAKAAEREKEMAKKAQKNHIYRIELSGSGLAIRIGKVPKRIWQYVETECDGSAYSYRQKWGNDLPKNMQLWKGDSSSDALDQVLWDDWKYRGRFLAKIDACIPDGAWISVSDEDGHSVFEAGLDEDAYGEVSFDETGKMPKIVHSEATFPQSKHGDNYLFCLTTLYRGTWAQYEVEASQFDPSKLVIGLTTLLCDPYGNGVTYIGDIDYDGDSGDIIDNEWLDVMCKDEGMLQFYDATPPDDGKLAELNGSQWAGLLARQPQFADKCGEWAKFEGRDWASLLAKQPQFADKCKWSKLDDRGWNYLLKRQPQFADKRGR